MSVGLFQYLIYRGLIWLNFLKLKAAWQILITKKCSKNKPSGPATDGQILCRLPLTEPGSKDSDTETKSKQIPSIKAAQNVCSKQLLTLKKQFLQEEHSLLCLSLQISSLVPSKLIVQYNAKIFIINDSLDSFSFNDCGSE